MKCRGEIRRAAVGSTHLLRLFFLFFTVSPLLQACNLVPSTDTEKVAAKQYATAISTATTNALKPNQVLNRTAAPQSPEFFNPDPSDTGYPPAISIPHEPELLSVRIPESNAPPQPPVLFNPDPGGALTPPPEEPFYRTNYGRLPAYGSEPIDPPQELPRSPVRRRELIVTELPIPTYGTDPLPADQKLPREQTRENLQIRRKFHAPHYPGRTSDEHLPPGSAPVFNRWHVPFAPWQRYQSSVAETPYQSASPALWHPYRQSVLKGDVPVIGQDIFLNLSTVSVTEMEARRLPKPSGVSSENPGSTEFFGESQEQFLLQNFQFNIDLFQGETVFQPVHWALRLQPVLNVNAIDVEERGIVHPNVRRGTTRTKDHLTLQEWFGELHLADLSDNYDFAAIRAGSQLFNSDFRGFIFNDTNLGARVFGNWSNNVYQYNLALFEMLEKETNSELNTFDKRDQEVIIANLYHQDFLARGYTAQLSFHANLDNGVTHYDENSNITRPAPIGTVEEHDVRAYYFGWAGDGHIGKWNVSHAAYQVFGRDTLNGLAGQAVDIDARMAALELSYDRDWIRYKASFFYASGDSDTTDSNANGFDSIVDNPNFIGGIFSYWAHQGFNLAGTSVNLKTRNSLLPNLRTSKTEGQANFVNPGIFIYGIGTEIEVTPKLRNFMNLNYLRFAETDPIKTALLTDRIDEEIGWDASIGFQYRPLLNDNIIISAGLGALIPGKGYRDIYRTSTDPVTGYGDSANAGKTDDFLYSGLLTVTLTY